MSEELLKTLLPELITLAGVVVTVVVSNNRTKSLLLYRIEQLEKKQDKYNHLQERMSKAELHEAVIDEEIKVANHRISDLEHFHK